MCNINFLPCCNLSQFSHVCISFNAVANEDQHASDTFNVPGIYVRESLLCRYFWQGLKVTFRAWLSSDTSTFLIISWSSKWRNVTWGLSCLSKHCRLVRKRLTRRCARKAVISDDGSPVWTGNLLGGGGQGGRLLEIICCLTCLPLLSHPVRLA